MLDEKENHNVRINEKLNDPFNVTRNVLVDTQTFFKGFFITIFTRLRKRYLKVPESTTFLLVFSFTMYPYFKLKFFITIQDKNKI